MDALLGDELVVAAPLDHHALDEHQDLVGVADRRRASMATMAWATSRARGPDPMDTSPYAIRVKARRTRATSSSMATMGRSGRAGERAVRIGARTPRVRAQPSRLVAAPVAFSSSPLCTAHRSAWTPSWAMSSSWLPRSTTTPSTSTRIWSALRIVDEPRWRRWHGPRLGHVDLTRWTHPRTRPV